MSDTTDAAAHARAIRQKLIDLQDITSWYTPDEQEQDVADIASDINDHAAALDAARVAAEARADAEHARAGRWKRLAEGWEDDFREQMQGQHHEFVEKTIQQMRNEHLHPDDLDAEPGDTEGEAQP